ncbi:MAG TPA: cyclic nucleotide-binding domain-containing protein [Vicinamibacteria bacterium]|nr:cyclic nucleotide-binding domain-containing protein [Vicinamibacteria bacterium]
MVLDWLSRSGRPPTVEELVAKGRYAQAAASFRAQLQGRTPTLDERLRLADLLVLAERAEEAVPILLGVADELARYGFNDRALEALRRVDAVAPGRSEVRQRFEALSRAARARIAAARSEVHAPEAKTDPYGEAPRPAAPRHREPADGESPPLDTDLLAFVRGLGDTPAGRGRAGLAAVLLSALPHDLFRQASAGLHRRAVPAGEIVVNEGDPGDSLFLIAGGSVRVLVMGGHGRPLEIRRLDAGDFFGEVAALSGRPRSATVVAVAGCEFLEVDRWALETLVEHRPAARPILEGARDLRTQSPEEVAVRSLPGEASPERAAAVLAAHFGAAEWSPRVRLHFARLMLNAGLENDALAVVASVAEEMARDGHAETAIAMLRKVDLIRKHRGGAAPPASRAAAEAAFRVWVGSLAQGDALLRAAASAPEEKQADRDGEG